MDLHHRQELVVQGVERRLLVGQALVGPHVEEHHVEEHHLALVEDRLVLVGDHLVLVEDLLALEELHEKLEGEQHEKQQKEGQVFH